MCGFCSRVNCLLETVEFSKFYFMKRNKNAYLTLIKILQNKWTALHLASSNGHDEVVRVLLSTKATVNTLDKVGCIFCLHFNTKNWCNMCHCMYIQWRQTPVFLASFKGHQKCVKLLINAGANVDLQKAVSVFLSVCSPTHQSSFYWLCI